MSQREDDTVLHQREHEALIVEMLDGIVDNTAIEDLDALTGGETPTETEHNLVVAALNDVLAALRNSKIIPSE